VLRPRIIPCLLVHKNGLVKTVRFQRPKYVGDPINAVKIFNEKEADELMVLDIDATARKAEPNYRMISHLAVECRMPLCYGGGIETPEQAKRIVGLGVEKVSVSAAAMRDGSLVTQISQEIGRQSLVVVLDVRRRGSGSDYDVWTHNAQRNTGRSVFSVAEEMEHRGAGEIVINSIDNDGEMQGYDLALAKRIRETVKIPITLLGGAGSLKDVESLFATCGVVGAAAGSIFVFKGTYHAVLINYPDPEAKEAMFRRTLAPELLSTAKSGAPPIDQQVGTG
jgi:cyclase